LDPLFYFDCKKLIHNMRPVQKYMDLCCKINSTKLTFKMD